MLVLAVAAMGCQEQRPVIPTAASLFIPTIQGVWSGPMTLLGTSGGECVGSVVPSFLPSTDLGTVSISTAQTGTDLLATLTMESTGLACRYSGTTTGANLAMNATSCDRTGLLVQCIEGPARELRLVGSSVTATWNGTQITGVTTSTYNVFTPPEGQQLGVGSLIATHSFTATRR
jgi:hypothetical protein